MVLVNLSIYYIWKNIKSEYNNNKFKIAAPTWNDTFDSPDGPYSIADIEDYFEFIVKKTQNFDWKSSHTNLPKQNQRQNCFQNKKRIQISVVNS